MRCNLPVVIWTVADVRASCKQNAQQHVTVLSGYGTPHGRLQRCWVAGIPGHSADLSPWRHGGVHDNLHSHRPLALDIVALNFGQNGLAGSALTQ